MALPASGQISMNDIRVELGVPSQSPFSLNTARQGGYVALNQFSPSVPPYSGQVSLASWYNYCQSCGYSTIQLGYSAVDVVTACGTTPSTTYYYTGTLTTGNTIYTNISQTIANEGYYSNGTDWWYQSMNQSEQILITDYGSCSSPSYDFYYADYYDCADCGQGVIGTILVCFLAGSSVTIGRFYQPQGGADGFAYKVTSTASQGDPAYILTTSFGSVTTCTLACSV